MSTVRVPFTPSQINGIVYRGNKVVKFVKTACSVITCNCFRFPVTNVADELPTLSKMMAYILYCFSYWATRCSVFGVFFFSS